MKTIATINTAFPSVDDYLSYHSGASLLDFDLAVIDPAFPHLSTVSFTNGGHCISIDSAKSASTSLQHWRKEILSAIKRGSTIFVILSKSETENFAHSTTSARRNELTYNTSPVNNYSILPGSLSLRNAKGRRISVKDDLFKSIFVLIKDIIEYQIIIEDTKIIKAGFAANDGSVLGGVASFKEMPGHIVYLPYFTFEGMTRISKGKEVWTPDAITKSRGVTKQLIEIDRALRAQIEDSPPPDWVTETALPKAASIIENEMVETGAKIAALEDKKKHLVVQLEDLTRYRTLLHGTGKPLEVAIERALAILGYKVRSFRAGDVEIDHIIEGPDGQRMIGEAEGKDTSAVAIGKFRQLESNINEDFSHDDVEKPAKGILFGNGYRLTRPSDRPNEFTEKCITNAKRLGTALVRTSDLYPLVSHLLDNPDDNDFKKRCRDAIETTSGAIVQFPVPNSSS